MKIILTGGAGFIGSELAEFFCRYPKKYQLTVIDNLKRGDIKRLKKVFIYFNESFLLEESIETLIH